MANTLDMDELRTELVMMIDRLQDVVEQIDSLSPESRTHNTTYVLGHDTVQDFDGND